MKGALVMCQIHGKAKLSELAKVTPCVWESEEEFLLTGVNDFVHVTGRYRTENTSVQFRFKLKNVTHFGLADVDVSFEHSINLEPVC